jgi:hypothetical protein
MPEISRFYGIIIRMFVKGREHNPPHFHAYYGEFDAEFDINTLELIAGKLPNTALYLVKQWAQIHQSELKAIWERQEFKDIEPLP